MNSKHLEKPQWNPGKEPSYHRLVIPPGNGT